VVSAAMEGRTIASQPRRKINRRVEVICLLVTMRALITCDCMKPQIASSDKRFLRFFWSCVSRSRR
jgi:hypothetical protein